MDQDEKTLKERERKKLWRLKQGSNSRKDPIIRFFEKIEKTDTCWLWLGNTAKFKEDEKGYGNFWFDSKNHMAHRFSYEIHVGPIPNDKELDHLCRVRNCVNPDHLEPVTHKVNMERGEIATKTICKNGHKFTSNNTKIMPDGHRECKTCRKVLKEKHLNISKQKTIEKRAKYTGPINPLTGNPIKTHCKRGHELKSGDFKFNKSGARLCLLCRENAKLILLKASEILSITKIKTHCPHGHEFTPENTRINTKGFRICRACHRKTCNLGKYKDRTKCINGHPNIPENIYISPKGKRECNLCKINHAKIRQEKIKKRRKDFLFGSLTSNYLIRT
jgi:hypothetical protein